jgi:dUTP pyrophosphatase
MHVAIRAVERAVVPAQQTQGSLGYDLAALDTVIVPAQQMVYVDTGLSLTEDLPPNVAMFITPRSSLFGKLQLTIPNSPGLVDTDYAGPIKVMVYNHASSPVTIPAGTRIAQAVFVQVVTPLIIQTLKANPERTREGFGSTG